MFDLIIKNGNIIDGTGNKPKKSDIGINADKIVTIGDLRDHEAKTIVDAEGLCVSPGFKTPAGAKSCVCQFCILRRVVGLIYRILRSLVF